MIPEAPMLDALAQAMTQLGRAERERAAAWAWAASGLLDPGAGRQTRMQAEREIEAARESVRRAREALGALPFGEKAWGGH